MMVLMDVLQTLGVTAGSANAVAPSLCRDQGSFQRMLDDAERKRGLVSAITGSSPSFIEIYGRVHIVDASNDLRRNLNVTGLHALDIRTVKPNGQI